LTIAILIGLGVAVTARVSGLFNGQPAPPAPKKQAEIQVLVAAKNLFSGMLIDGTGVRVRTLKPEEMEHYQNNKDQYLPPVVNAAVMRVAKQEIVADQPILQSQLEKLEKPEPLNARLLPSMRAVSVSVEKDNSGGGMIQVGDWVDVLLTSNITSGGKTITRTATLAPKVRVIAKRNSLWQLFVPLPEGKPLQFTLEMNPYRASLFEYAKTKGVITLALLSASEQKQLEQHHAALLQKPEPIQQVHFVLFATPEGAQEDDTVAKYNQGELVVGEWDLIKMFNLTTSAPPEPAVAIEQVGGLNHYKAATFDSSGKRFVSAGGPQLVQPNADSNSSAASPAFEFSPTAPLTKECQKCKKGKKS
jgi:pilus assembly protein CpaB